MRVYNQIAGGSIDRVATLSDGVIAFAMTILVLDLRVPFMHFVARSRSAMTVAHEFGHALDCALGGGVYRSGLDPRIRAAFAAAREYVTPYASTGLDEYFAEALHAYVEINDPASPWPPATRERLRRIDPEIYAYVDGLFAIEFVDDAAA